MSITSVPSELMRCTKFMTLAEAGVLVTLSLVCVTCGRLPLSVAYRLCRCESARDRDLVQNVLRTHFVSARGGWQPKDPKLFGPIVEREWQAGAFGTIEAT